MIPWNYIKELADCYIEAKDGGEFWKLSDVIEDLMDYDDRITDDAIDAEFRELRICMMGHFKHAEEVKE